MHYRWHPCAVRNFALDQLLSLHPPPSEQVETRHLHAMLQLGNELAHQRLKAYPGGSGIWLAAPDLPSEEYLVFKF